jgi:hypothetical protein
LQLLPGKTPEFFDSETAAVVAMKKSVFLQCLALNIIDGKETRPTKISIKKQIISTPFLREN